MTIVAGVVRPAATYAPPARTRSTTKKKASHRNMDTMIRGLLVLVVPKRQGRYRLGVRTRGSQPRDRGSNPRTGTIHHRSPLDNSPAHRAGLFLVPSPHRAARFRSLCRGPAGAQRKREPARAGPPSGLGDRL